MKFAYISTYPPRECGIATFNFNLMKAIDSNIPDNACSAEGCVVALNDSDDAFEYKYPKDVGFVIRQNQQRDYSAAAAFLNTGNADIVILEHEFGIYGGESGIYVLPMLHRLKKPLVSILHTILDHPSFIQKIIIQEIAQQSELVVVMSKRSVESLVNIYGLQRAKIRLIEHGVPDLEATVPNPVKSLTAFQGHKVLFTFGLINRNKGLETVIKALPFIVDKHPEVMYVILGNTHPGVIRNSGEEYREELKKLAIKLGVESHISFINKFVSEAELVDYLAAADVYITPYLNEAQSTSGTLSYAVGAGAAVLSTPYWHATELLADDRGRLFQFKDYEELAWLVTGLLDNPEELGIIKENAYNYGLKTRWPRIGAEYIKAAKEALVRPVLKDTVRKRIIDPELIPPFSLNHVKRLTDDTGIVQHAKYGIPNLKEGYCLDDNSRALIMALMAFKQNKSKEALDLLPIYLSFIHYMQRDDGNFRNFLHFNRSYMDEIGSEDSFGRTVWALGYAIQHAPNNSYREFAQELFYRSVPHFENLQDLRGLANTLIGISYYLKVNPGDERLLDQLNKLTARIVKAYQDSSDDKWKWFEETLTYDNAILVLALLHSCEINADDQARSIALEALSFLDKVCFKQDCLMPVGNNGWYSRGKDMAMYDQQAIEAMAMVLMYFQAYLATQQTKYIEKTYLSYRWFLGENTLRAPLYDRETQGCCDGLEQSGINRNQGAESTLAYMISHITVLQALELEYQYEKPDKAEWHA